MCIRDSYFIQAERQLEGSGITLMRMAQPGVPTVEEWLADRMPAGGTLALDGACTCLLYTSRCV